MLRRGALFCVCCSGAAQMYSSSFARAVSSARQSGWAMPISARVRWRTLRPRRAATPYSVTT